MNIADVNKLVDEMITKVGDGVSCVDHLKLLIEKEHEAILKKDISELQKATEMKTRGMDTLSESLEMAFNLTKKIRGELIETEVPHSGEMTLTSLIDEALQSIQNHHHRGGELTQKVHLLKEKTLELITVVRNVQPLIQKNFGINF